MTFNEAMSALASGATVSRTAASDGNGGYNFVLYLEEGVLKVDSGELVGVLGWRASSDEQAATDWLVVS